MPRRRTASVLLELHSTDRVVRTLVYEELARRGLAPNLLAILALIDIHQPVTPTRLALETGVRPTTLRDMIGDMIERGHVRRIENPDDGRSHLLVVTPAGAKFIDEGMPALAAVQEELEQRLGRSLEDLRTELTALRRAARSALATAEETRIRAT
jgi:DNA-binding MarR family transcriptional regulator